VLAGRVAQVASQVEHFAVAPPLGPELEHVGAAAERGPADGAQVVLHGHLGVEQHVEPRLGQCLAREMEHLELELVGRVAERLDARGRLGAHRLAVFLEAPERLLEPLEGRAGHVVGAGPLPLGLGGEVGAHVARRVACGQERLGGQAEGVEPLAESVAKLLERAGEPCRVEREARVVLGHAQGLPRAVRVRIQDAQGHLIGHGDRHASRSGRVAQEAPDLDFWARTG